MGDTVHAESSGVQGKWDVAIQSYVFVSLLATLLFVVFLYKANPPFVQRGTDTANGTGNGNGTASESLMEQPPSWRKLFLSGLVLMAAFLIAPLVAGAGTVGAKIVAKF
jgi:hypothetical protein